MNQALMSEQELNLANLIKLRVRNPEDKELAVFISLAVHLAEEYDTTIVKKAIAIAENDGTDMQYIISKICDILPPEINDADSDDDDE